MDTNLAHTRLTTKPFAFPKIQEPRTLLSLLGHRATICMQPLGIRTRVMDLRHHRVRRKTKSLPPNGGLVQMEWQNQTADLVSCCHLPCSPTSSSYCAGESPLVPETLPPQQRPLRTLAHPPLSTGFPFWPLSPPVLLLTTWKTPSVHFPAWMYGQFISKAPHAFLQNL